MYGLKYDENPDFSSCLSFQADVLHLAKENVKRCIQTAWDADEFLKVFGAAESCMHDYFISACREHIGELSNKPEFENILRSDSELAKELTMMLRKSLKSYCCLYCKQLWSMNCSVSSPLFCPYCARHEQDWVKFMKWIALRSLRSQKEIPQQQLSPTSQNQCPKDYLQRKQHHKSWNGCFERAFRHFMYPVLEIILH